ncbi:MAG TPA: energy transducer TonB [Burkholderiaceae bacterium]|nr:energy transducer TonB [Burkholderiaceae bacterium]
MHQRIALLLAVAALAACSSVPLDSPQLPPPATEASRVEDAAGGASGASSLAAYKVDLAKRIAQANPIQVFGGRPQALLRSVVVVKYQVDANGRLLGSNILRSNHDRVTENTALAALRKAAPFPRPAAYLLRHGQVEVLETWLFNNDGRFQLRTIAEAQSNE